ncbi:MAG TPA: histidine phosphatase family protein [Jatrophihabitantaceae bacterium]
MSEFTTSEAGSRTEPAFVVPGPVRDDTELWLIRHGETEWSKSGQHTGRTDLPLTPDGERQAAALGTMLQNVHPVLVLSSPRQRALRTAEIAGLKIDAIDPDLAEWDYGDYEGLTTAQIRERVPDWSLWTHPVPGGETPHEVATRADRVLRRALPHLADGPVVFVAHGHISRVIGARWIGLDVLDGGRLALGTAAPSVLGGQHGTPVIERWNVPNPAAQ